MLNLSALSRREKIYLAELARTFLDSRFEIGPDTLNCLKPGVLQLALQNLVGKIHARKVRVLEKILQKISYPQILEGELIIPADNLLEEPKEIEKL